MKKKFVACIYLYHEHAITNLNNPAIRDTDPVRLAKSYDENNVDDFIKKTSIISYSREALEKVSDDIQLFARNEGLTAHANSIKVRFEE